MVAIDISFVIPCYCSEKNLEFVVQEIRTAMGERPAFQYEIVLVNDHSRDGTLQLIDRLAAEDSRIVGIHFSKNFGQPAALMAGFRAARGAYIMTSDDDGQTPVGMVWDFYDKMQEGYDVVSAKYLTRPQKSLIRKMGTRVNELMLQGLLQKPKDMMLASFFMARRGVIEEMTQYEGPYPYIAGLILRSSGNIANLEMVQRERKNGQSGYSFSKLLKLWANGFTAFSIKPLRLAAILGGVSAVAGVILMLIMLVRKLVIPAVVVGLHVQTGVILLIAGLILAAIGLTGEYIGRIYMCINREPQYIIAYQTQEKRDD